MKKGVKYFIAASVFLNVLLLGIVTGGAIQNSDYLSNLMKERQLSTLSQERKAEYLLEMEQVEKENTPLRDQVQKLRDENKKILTAKSFNQAAYAANIEKLRALRDAQGKRMGSAIYKLAGKWSQSERETLSNLLQIARNKK